MKRDLQNPELNSLLPDVQVDRRGFVAACLAAGFAVTAEPLLAQRVAESIQPLRSVQSERCDLVFDIVQQASVCHSSSRFGR